MTRSNTLAFIKGVDRLHAFYTENVRMLAHAYELNEQDAAMMLERFGYHNVARSILAKPRVDVFEGLYDDIPDPE